VRGIADELPQPRHSSAPRGHVAPNGGSEASQSAKQLDTHQLRGDRTMLGTTGVLLAALAVVCVMLEATWPAAVFGAVGMWMISHAA
jgi:hypothetical protein